MLNFQILIFAIKTAFNGQLQPLKRFAVFALAAIFQVFIVDFLQFFLTQYFVMCFVVAITAQSNYIQNRITFILLFFAEVGTVNDMMKVVARCAASLTGNKITGYKMKMVKIVFDMWFHFNKISIP